MTQPELKILLVDDNPSIHEDFINIFKKSSFQSSKMIDIENELFNIKPSDQNNELNLPDNEIHHAYQGDEAVNMVQTALDDMQPYSIIFMDVRMPPGIDGIKTVQKIWEIAPETEIIICTAYSDYTWDEIVNSLGTTHQLLFIKKPFDGTTLKQLTLSTWEKTKQLKQAQSKDITAQESIDKRSTEIKQMSEYIESIEEELVRQFITKNTLLSKLHKDISTPLNSIAGISDMLLETSLDNIQQQYAELISRSSTSMLKLLQKIIDIHDLQCGSFPLEQAFFNLHSTINDIFSAAHTDARSKNINIIQLIHANVPYSVFSDLKKIQNILTHLLSNAIQYTPQGLVIFETSLHSIDENLCHITFTIEDNGPGISDEIVRELDDASDMLNNNSEKSNLLITKNITERLGGTFSIFTSATGTTIKATIPMQYIKESFHNISAAHDINSLHCLCLSENNITSKSISLHICQWGGYCSTAAATTSALDKLHTALHTKPYDIIIIEQTSNSISDIIDAGQSIKKQQNLQHLQMIAIVSSITRKDFEKLVSTGFCSIITKPFSEQTLLSTLRIIKSQSFNTDNVNTKIITSQTAQSVDPDYYNVIILETDRNKQIHLSGLLQQFNIRCTTATSVKEVKETMQSTPYDLIMIGDAEDSYNPEESATKIPELQHHFIEYDNIYDSEYNLLLKKSLIRHLKGLA